MPTQLDGMVVFITGASGGIGRALATSFADEGASLVLHANTQGKGLLEFVDSQSWKDRALCVSSDVRDFVELQKNFDAAVARFGRVDICIANAGIWPEDAHLLSDMPQSLIRDVIDVNLLGTIWTSQSFMKVLAQTGPRTDGRGASLCFIGSTAGHFGEAFHSPYAASKAAMVGLMLSLKNEIVRLDPYARVNLVEPGWTCDIKVSDCASLPDFSDMRPG
jgi:3-oxoacyl-[acyl-carrier protein] reductase